MFTFFTPNVEKLKSKNDKKGLEKALGYKKDININLAAAVALGELGYSWGVFEALALFLASPNDEYCEKGIRAIGQVRSNMKGSRAGGNYALNTLIESLKLFENRKGPNDLELAQHIRQQLSGSGYGLAVDALIRCLGHRRTEIQELAIEVLGNMDEPKAIAPIEAFANYPHDGIRAKAKAAVEKLRTCEAS